MSITATNWVWGTKVPQTEKIVLLWLAHVANASNASWYSVRKIALQCNISCRTAQRAIANLIKSGHLITKRRMKLDGSYDSNMYILPIESGNDKLTPGSDSNVTTPCHIVQIGGVTGDTLNTSRNIIETTNNENIQNSSSTKHLVYPILDTNELIKVKQLLKNVEFSLAQMLLDELSGCCRDGSLQRSPSAYLNGIIKKAKIGLFKQSSRGEKIFNSREMNSNTKINYGSSNDVIRQGLARMHQVLKTKRTN